MKMLFLVFALATIVGPAFAQDGHIPGLGKPTDCVMTRIKSIQGRLEGSSPRESGAAVEYENGAYGVQYQLGDNPDKEQPGAAIIGSKRHMRTTSLLLVLATLLNYAWFRSRCTAPRGMDVDVNMLPSTCAIIGGGISATANTCAGARKV
jgi:hypothetical protein